MAQVVSPKDLVRGVFAALDAKDPAAVSARMTDDVRMRLGNADLVEGKAKFHEATTAFVASISAIRHEITSMWSVDDVVIAEMDVHYERLDGRTVTLPCCNVFRVRDGLVSDYRVYLDIGPVYA
ncbi:MAG TPA: nuclear transport factor 2 family protein [Solirubrobacteraceae bacterium]|nr:nuclear transport factor 2 family protein [Solirubrobacteraceae bacterium]